MCQKTRLRSGWKSAIEVGELGNFSPELKPRQPVCAHHSQRTDLIKRLCCAGAIGGCCFVLTRGFFGHIPGLVQRLPYSPRQQAWQTCQPQSREIVHCTKPRKFYIAP